MTLLSLKLIHLVNQPNHCSIRLFQKLYYLLFNNIIIIIIYIKTIETLEKELGSFEVIQ